MHYLLALTFIHSPNTDILQVNAATSSNSSGRHRDITMSVKTILKIQVGEQTARCTIELPTDAVIDAHTLNTICASCASKTTTAVMKAMKPSPDKVNEEAIAIEHADPPTRTINFHSPGRESAAYTIRLGTPLIHVLQ